MTYKIDDLVEPIEGYTMPSDLQQWLDENNAHAILIIKNDRYYFHIISNEDPDYKLTEIYRLKRLLFDTDYITAKIIEADTLEEQHIIREQYADVIAQRKQWRARINQLEEQ